MITNFKTFEGVTKFNELYKKDYRIVNLPQLKYDLFKYRKKFNIQLGDFDDYWIDFLKMILIDKEVEYDGFNEFEEFFGRVKNIIGEFESHPTKQESYVYLSISLYDAPELRYRILINKGNESSFIKIYNSDENKIEQEINLLKSMEKYNI